MCLFQESVRIGQLQAEQVINKTDKSRANYYNFYSGMKWGDPENYDLSVNRTKLTLEQAVGVIQGYLKVVE
jgi:cytidylate kinase